MPTRRSSSAASASASTSPSSTPSSGASNNSKAVAVHIIIIVVVVVVVTSHTHLSFVVEFRMRAHFGLPSVQDDDIKDKRPPIKVTFEIPYFTSMFIDIK
jgi:hypothetical protein